MDHINSVKTVNSQFDDRGLLISTASTVMMIMLLFVALRLYAKTRILRQATWDDGKEISRYCFG